MEDQIEEIKRKADIVSVVSQYVALKKAGTHHKGLCPFHSEKTPSFTVNEELNFYKCFGCGAGGDVIKFVMEIEGIEFREALERLADRVGVTLVYKRNQNDDDRQKLLEVLELAARYYHWILVEGKSGQIAREYLEQRKISSKLIETFNIGFAMQSWDGLINYLVKKKGYSEDILIKAGLVSKRSDGTGVFDKFRGRVMFPLQDAGGKVVGFSGRILPSLAKEEEPKYMNTPETELYHKGKMLYGFFQAKQHIREAKRVVLVEGQMDMISSFGAGVGETVAVGGTALTPDQVEMLARLAEKIYFSLDDDDAGTAAIKRSVEIAEKRGLGIKVVQIEGGKDPDEIARNYPNKWKEMVEKAVDVYQYVMEKAFKKYDMKSVDGIQKITEEVIPFLAKIENRVIREVWSKRLAEKLGVDTSGVLGEIERDKTRKQETIGFTPLNKVVKVESQSKIVKLAWQLIGCLLSNKDIKKDVVNYLDGLMITGAEGKIIYWLLNNEYQNTKDVVDRIPSELKDLVGEIYMKQDESAEVTARELKLVSIQLAKEVIRERKIALTEERKIIMVNKDDEKEVKIDAELSELDKKLRELYKKEG